MKTTFGALHVFQKKHGGKISNILDKAIACNVIYNMRRFESAVKVNYMEGFPSGQRGQTVNLLSVTSVVRIHPPPPEP